jgi:hypothetical protein
LDCFKCASKAFHIQSPPKKSKKAKIGFFNVFAFSQTAHVCVRWFFASLRWLSFLDDKVVFFRRKKLTPLGKGRISRQFGSFGKILNFSVRE